jgi:hypothetical protein
MAIETKSWPLQVLVDARNTMYVVLIYKQV